MNCRYCGTPLPEGALFCVECGRPIGESEQHPGSLAAFAPRVPADDSRFTVTSPIEVVASTPPSDVAAEPASPSSAALEDLEPTRMHDRPATERFVLQFSTGESVVVAGTGLIGRNPAAEPGEFVDQLVAVFDVGKSVSKSHVEFGQEAGRFWISDRFSTNGTIVRQPDAAPVRCEPGKRYMIARGTRVDVGEQFFIVS